MNLTRGALSASTPEMKTALEIGIAAVTYDAEGRFSEAFDRYESAISILLKLLKCEPKGHRQKLIQQQVLRFAPYSIQLLFNILYK